METSQEACTGTELLASTNSEAEARPVVSNIISTELARVGIATKLNRNLWFIKQVPHIILEDCHQNHIPLNLICSKSSTFSPAPKLHPT
jgi:hypothetical protein